MRIANNIMAMNTHRFYTNNNNAVSKSAEKLSSGYRINRAGDDAAGLAISEKMRAQVRGLNMAKKNSQDAVSLVQTAEGALQEVHSMLQRMNELAVQSATGTNDSGVDRNALQQEFQNLQDEIDQIADTTTFNDMRILDGTYAAADPGNTTPGGATGATLTADTIKADATSNTAKVTNDSITADTIKAAIEGANITDAVETETGLTVAKNADGKSIDVSFGGKVIANSGDISAKLTGSQTTQAEIDFGALGKVKLDGVGADATIDDAATALADVLSGVKATYAPEAAAQADDPAAAGTPAGVSADVTLTGTAQDGDKITFASDDGSMSFEATYNATDDEWTIGNPTGIPDGYTAAFDGSKMTITADEAGAVETNPFDGLTFTATADGGNGGITTNGTVGTPTWEAGADAPDNGGNNAGWQGPLTIQTGAEQGQTLNISIDAMNTTGLSLTKAAVNIADQPNASAAITATRNAINKVSTQRAELGAMQNRLEYKINNLANTAENLSAAESRIRDVDIASEMTTFTKNNILSQAATAMLAQANSLPQNVLSLLR